MYHEITKDLTSNSSCFSTNMKKLFPRWVPRLLIVLQKRDRVRCSTEFCNIHVDIQETRLRSVTVDETWMRYYSLETEEQFKKWVVSSGKSESK